MDGWVMAIQSTMGGIRAHGDVKQKRNKPKRWESFKSTFSIQTRPHIEVSPERSLPAKKGKRTKSVANKIKLRTGGGLGRSRSPSPQVEGEVPFHKRPMSFHGEPYPSDTLEVAPEIAPTLSLPNTPLVTKRENAIPVVPPSPDLSEGQASDSTGRGDHDRTGTPNSIEVHEHEEEKLETRVATPPVPPPREKEVKIESVEPSSFPLPVPQSQEVARPVSPQPEVIIEHITPEFLRRPFVWDEVREMLDTAPSSEVDNYDDLPTEEQAWLEQPSAIEQLRTFLAVCP